MKAIIESNSLDNQYRVRIPKYHKLRGVSTATPTESLPYATICCQPGIVPSYEIGDIVYVDFENDNISYPVIFGKLLRQEDTQLSWSDIKTRSLKVDVDTTLSEETKIGNINYNDIQVAVQSTII